jgi:hypothetical protein
MKRVYIFMIVGTLLLMAAGVVITLAQESEADLTYLPTSIPAALPGYGDEAFNRIHGGVVYNGVAILGSEDENQLLIQIDAAQTQVPLRIIGADGTPVFDIGPDGAIDSAGLLDSSGYLKLGAATPSVVTSLGTGDLVVSDDAEVVDDLHVTGAMKVGVPTPNAGMTWDDDDLVVGDDFGVKDDSWFGDDVEINGNITLENDEVIDNGTNGSIKFTDGSNTLVTIVDIGTTGDLDVSGKVIMANDEYMENNVDAVINFKDNADNVLMSITDAGTTGTVAVTGAETVGTTLGVTGMTTHTGGETTLVNVENIGQPTWLTVPITTSATGTVATIGAGEIWVIHDVLFKVTTNYDSGESNDCTLTVGDGNVEAGFLDLDDADLQAAFTEGTGFSAGWLGMDDDQTGVYLDETEYGFVYDESGAETIDYAIGGTGTENGVGTIYVFYTRIQ